MTSSPFQAFHSILQQRCQRPPLAACHAHRPVTLLTGLSRLLVAERPPQIQPRSRMQQGSELQGPVWGRSPEEPGSKAVPNCPQERTSPTQVHLYGHKVT